jgi:GntR family transcriptional regulator/MocR family aminotransferase
MPRTQTNSGSPASGEDALAWELVLDLEGQGPGPLHRRLARALRDAVRTGRLEVGVALPPSRTLAADLGISRWAVTEAYAQLVSEGYLEARTGSATRVRWRPAEDADVAAGIPAPAPRARYDLAPGLPDLRAFPRRAWTEALRREASSVPFTDLGYRDAEGHPRLRAALARYLERSRAVSLTGPP